jgi:hypothetical protein
MLGPGPAPPDRTPPRPTTAHLREALKAEKELRELGVPDTRR